MPDTIPGDTDVGHPEQTVATLLALAGRQNNKQINEHAPSGQREESQGQQNGSRPGPSSTIPPGWALPPHGPHKKSSLGGQLCSPHCEPSGWAEPRAMTPSCCCVLSPEVRTAPAASRPFLLRQRSLLGRDCSHSALPAPIGRGPGESLCPLPRPGSGKGRLG